MSREDYTVYDFATVKFCDYITAITGKPVVLEKSNTPQLDEPYLSVILSDVNLLPHDIVDMTEVIDPETEVVTTNEVPRGLGILNFTVIGYGGDPISDLAKVQKSFETSAFIFGLEVYGFGLSDKGVIINTTAPLIDARFESRAELKCSFYHSASETFTAEYFTTDKVTIVKETYNETFNGEEPPGGI